jgi:transposase
VQCLKLFKNKVGFLDDPSFDRGMPQIQLPIFPTSSTHITNELAFCKQDGRVTYFVGHLPVFIHDENDLATFRMITSQFIVNGQATQSQISEAFGVPKDTVKRYVKRYRAHGPKGFYERRKTRGATVLTEEKLVELQQRLNEGATLPEAAKALGLKSNTVNKAFHAGRLYRPRAEKKTIQPPSSQSQKANEPL